VIWLALDTATDRASVAVGTAAAAHAATLQGARRHAAALPGLVDQALATAGLHLRDVAGVIVANGPGSFTGLRVGASVAKALARARSLPLWTAPSLLARAYGAAPRDGRLVVVLADALRGDVYAAAYRISSDTVETVLRPAVLRPEQVRAHCGTPDCVVSAAAPAAAAVVHRGAVPVVEGEAAAPDAAALLALRELAGGAQAVGDVAGWEPEYGRPAEAQARWEETHGRPLPHQAGSRG
jgi:tRNA threonylcarbamoyladenosine biosynthesis protein TsaB